MTRIPILLLGLATTACAGGDMLSQAAVTSVTIRGGYRAVASCSYQRLDASQGTGIKKVDLQGSSRVALESGGIRYWELVFTPQGTQTRVDYSTVNTMWGADTTRASQILGDIQACGR